MPSCAFTPSRCHIDIAQLQRNFSLLGSPDRLMPVIKADAYGHGLLPVAQALATMGAHYFAVGTVDEGRLLREQQHTQTILPLLGQHSHEDWKLAAGHRLLPLLATKEDLHAAIHVCPANTSWNIALKLDTGMGRLGFTEQDIPALIDLLRSYPQLTPHLALSHLAVADDPEERAYTEEQQQRFCTMTDALRSVFPQIKRSLGNSAGTLAWEQAHFELCRPGFALYGGNPLANTAWASQGEHLHWVMSFSAPIVQIRHLNAGQTISYGRIFTAPKAMTIAVVACGYATGVPRALSGKISVLLQGQRAPQIGRICMGMMMIDISHLPSVSVGEEVWLWGGQTKEGVTPVTPLEWATALDTIPYELLCTVGTMNPRCYHH